MKGLLFYIHTHTLSGAAKRKRAKSCTRESRWDALQKKSREQKHSRLSIIVIIIHRERAVERPRIKCTLSRLRERAQIEWGNISDGLSAHASRVMVHRNCWFIRCKILNRAIQPLSSVLVNSYSHSYPRLLYSVYGFIMYELFAQRR